MYSKPELQKFGSMRELTLIGCDPDADGGVFGVVNGSLGNCFDEDRS